MYNFGKWGLRCMGLGFAIMLVWKALEVRPAQAADFIYACTTVGADAGNTVLLSNTTGGPNPNTQFMVTTTLPVNYRVCRTSTCTATPTDAPIPNGAQVDLCMPSGYPYISFYKLYDGGNPSVCTYLVSPKTVCQINTP